MEETRTRDIVLMGMSSAALLEREQFIQRAYALARHMNGDAALIARLADIHAAVEHELQCREDEGDVPF